MQDQAVALRLAPEEGFDANRRLDLHGGWIGATRTYAPDASSEWTFALWHGRRQNVTGPSMVPGVNAAIGMSQNGIGLQYSRKF